MLIDLWALGATLSEFFTPMMFATMDSTIVVDLDSLQRSDSTRLDPYNFGKVETPETSSSEEEHRSEWSFASMRKGAMWTRQTMFDGGRGEIGLASSIFRLLGTPGDDDWKVSQTTPLTTRSTNWKIFKTLADNPERYRDMFDPMHAVRLDRVLPFADIWDNDQGGVTCTNDHISSGDSPTSTISFLQGLLQLSPTKRTTMAQCLDHPCFKHAVLPPSVYTSKNVNLRTDIEMDKNGLLRSWLACSTTTPVHTPGLTQEM
jgi:serine/threonine protein kinase